MHVFLDIDGVILPGRAWALPANAVLRDRAAKHSTAREAMLAATFDACAVALVNRLCERTGATLVVLSNWRRSLEAEELVEKLVEGGVERRHFHAIPACPMKFTSRKVHDMGFWFDEAYPLPEEMTARYDRDDVTLDQLNEMEQDWRRKAWAVPHVILDDEAVHFGRPGEEIRTGYDEGLTLKAYAAAVLALGGSDPEFGAHALPEGALDAAAPTQEGTRASAALWFVEPWEGGRSRAWWLSDAGVASTLERLGLDGSRADEARAGTLERMLSMAAWDGPTEERGPGSFAAPTGG